MREEAFRLQVRDLARYCGWNLMYHTHDSRRSDRGFPDEVFASEKWQRTLFIEFKSDKGRIRPEQAEWIRILRECGLEAAIFRPRDMDLIKDVLGTKQVNLLEASYDGISHGLIAARGGIRIPARKEGWEFPERLTEHTKK